MSDYTTQLRWPIERRQYETKSSPDDYSKCYDMLGLSDYPIFDESYRSFLNDKIIRHFYFREIGFETLAQFRWYMRNTMHENMPYFNQLYKSLNLITDPITNEKFTWGEVYSLAQGGGTTTDVDGKTHDKNNETDNQKETIKYGKTDTTEVEYGKTDNTTTTYGKTGGKTTNYGKTDHDVTTTDYGKTTHSENGGSDSNLEGAYHERVIHEDTPMNQISNSGVENLNYASDVTYTDRNGTGASVIEYGGTTDTEAGGEDVVTSDSRTGGTDTESTTTGGSDSVSGQLGGSDTTTERLGGSDVKTTNTEKDATHDGTSETATRYERELDEHGDREHNRIGYSGVSPSQLLEEYRKTFLNVDMQVIASLNILFFGLWN